jgi:hypothetical protein
MTALQAHERCSALSLVGPPRLDPLEISTWTPDTVAPVGVRGSWAAGLVLAVLSVSTAIVLAALLYRSSLRYPLNYNEGWNAFWAHRAAVGQSIYPSPGAMVFNNYPPLSFLLVGALSWLGLDVWIVGRIVAWLSFAGCAVLIRGVLRAWGRTGAAATLSAVLFCALMATDYNDYLGMYDPQLAAQFGMLIGFYLLVRAGLLVPAGLLSGSGPLVRPGPGVRPGAPSRLSVVFAACIIVVSLFVKHNVIALPAAITVWLALYRRDLLVTWLVTVAAGLAIGFLLCLAAFGADFLAGLATPRAWSAHNAVVKLTQWLPPVVLPALVALGLLFRPARDPTGMFLGLFAALGLATACLGTAGDGVVYNALFELVIAASLAVGYRGGGARSDAPDSWIALATAAIVAWSVALTAVAMIAYRSDWIAGRDRLVAIAQRSVAIIAAQPGPALCEDLLLCYWAGKPSEVDAFNYAQSVGAGRRDERALVVRIERGSFGAIELDPKENRLPPRVIAAISRYYKPVGDLPGLFVEMPRWKRDSRH